MNNLTAGFGDYLIPVLAIAWMIYSVVKKFGSGRAAPEAGKESEKETGSTGSIRTMLEEILLGEEFVNRPSSPNAAQTTTQEKSNPAILSSASEPAPFLTNELQLYQGGERGNDQVANPQGESVIYDKEVHETLLADFDLRRAVLYAEILKRPYP
jgi:hypothetical protein